MAIRIFNLISNLILWSIVPFAFFWTLELGDLGFSFFCAGIPLVAVVGVGLLERLDPRIGLPTLRWSVWNGTYQESSRISHVCSTCNGKGRI
jgi:hypothetical protein